MISIGINTWEELGYSENENILNVFKISSCFAQNNKIS